MRMGATDRLLAAAMLGEAEAARAALEAGAEAGAAGQMGWTALHWAGRLDAGDLARVLLGSADAEDLLGRRDEDGAGPGHAAASDDGARALRAMLEAGWDPGERDGDGWSALHRAAEAGALRALRELLRAGADPDDAGPRGVRPLELAIRSAGEECAWELAEAGADLRSRRVGEERPAWELARREGLEDLARRLEGLDRARGEARALEGAGAAAGRGAKRRL